VFRFDLLVRPSMTVSEIKILYPQTVPVFAKLGFRDVCDGCALELVARRSGLSASDVIDTLHSEIFRHEGRSQ
jgi:hypothetical protein